MNRLSVLGRELRAVWMLLGVALIHETREFVLWHWNKSEYVPVVVGLLLIASVAMNALLGRQSDK